MRINKNDMTLRQATELMRELQDIGYVSYFEGKGDGRVALIMEDVVIVENESQNM